MNNFEVHHIIKTKSFKSDGRLIKWIESLATNNIYSNVLMVDDENRSGHEAKLSYSIDYRPLRSRKFFSKRRGYIIKVIELFFITLKEIRRSSSKIFIFHDNQHYLSLLYYCLFKTKDTKLIWDLHELPHPGLSRFFISKKIVQFILNNVDIVIFTNHERRLCVRDLFSFEKCESAILNNFPSAAFIAKPKMPYPEEIKKWSGNQDGYILWMGLASETRNFLPVLHALESIKSVVKLIVMGSIEPNVSELIAKKGLSDSVFSKFVSQNEIVNYVDNALFSIVLYRDDSLNNFYCEPNRLYQLITRRIPVIVGINPPMKNMVEKFNSGIVLKDDGSDVNGLTDAIRLMLNDGYRATILANYGDVDDSLTWENQFNSILKKIKED